MSDSTTVVEPGDVASGSRFGALLGELPLTHRVDVIESLRHLVAALETLPGDPTEERKSE